MQNIQSELNVYKWLSMTIFSSIISNWSLLRWYCVEDSEFETNSDMSEWIRGQ